MPWILILLEFALRLAPLGRYVTPDEPTWVSRTIQFADALAARDLSALPPTGHPGVTTMWLGTAGIAVRRLLLPADSIAHLNWIRRLAWLGPENGEAFRRLSVFLPWGRGAVVLVTTLGLIALYPMLKCLFDRRVALLAIGLLAFDPLLIGYSGLLHTDALLAVFSLLTLVSALNGLKTTSHRGERRYADIAWWFLAGLFGGLSLLTKTPTIVVIGFILGLIAFQALRLTFYASRFRSQAPHFLHNTTWLILDALIFLTTIALVFFALHPGMWADPAGTLDIVFNLAGRHVTSVQRTIFFAGQMVEDPGPAFYPVVFLFRVSPVVLIGLVAGLIFLRRLPPDRRLAFLALIAFAVLFGAAMSMATKKHDRYLLPAFPPLALAGALGISILVDWYTGKMVKGTDTPNPPARRAYQLTNLLISQSTSLPILFQALIALVFAAYPLLYYNPLLGGPAVAARVLPTGWGERMGAAARQLNRRFDAEHLTVAVGNVPSFAPIFDGHTIPLEENTIPLSDYIVAPRDQITDLPTYPSADFPISQSTAIYTNTAPFEQAAYLAERIRPDDLILVDAETPLPRRYEGPGTLLSAADLEGAPNEAAVHEWLAERVSGRDIIWLVASPGASPITAAHLRRQVEVFAEPVSTATVASAAITRFEKKPGFSRNPVSTTSQIATFGGRLTLVDGALPRGVAWPDAAKVVLRWQAQPTPLADHQAVVMLRGEHLWNTRESLVRNAVNFPTSVWEAGEWSDASYKLELPAGIPPGDYAVEVSLYDVGTGAKLGASGPDGAFLGTQVPVGQVIVAPPADSPDVAVLKIPKRIDASIGPLTLLGMESPPEQVLSGDHLPFAIFWQADAAPDVDYHVRLRLVGPDGTIGMEDVQPLSPYCTSQWRAGDRFQSRYTLHITPTLPAGRYQLVLDVPGEKESVSLATTKVLPRERSFALPEDMPQRLDLTFGEQIDLRGYALPDAQVAPGDVIPLTLYWQADGPTDRGYTLFVHLLGSDGLPHGQVDRVPGNGAAPTSSWAAGQVIVEDIALPVAADAPPGTYRVAVGFYDASYGDRLVAMDSSGQTLAGDQAILTEIEVTEGGP